jgi:hypothetical protein
LLEACGIKTTLPNGDPDTGVLLASDAASVIEDFVVAMAKHRHFARETDPPLRVRADIRSTTRRQDDGRSRDAPRCIH